MRLRWWSLEGLVVERTIKRDLADLQEKGLLKRTGGRKDGVWIVVDMLTDDDGDLLQETKVLYNGNDVEKIKAGIKTLLENYDTYKKNVTAKDCGLWSSQEVTIKDIMDTFIKK